jgi:amidase
MHDPSTMSATELTRVLRRREVSSRELLNHYLHRIEADAGVVNAVITVDEDTARAQAAAADEALVRGEPTGPLYGLPMTVKDVLETAGMRTTAGALELAGHVPDRDADAVARLRAAGAVIFGKTNTPPYATDYQTSNPLFGRTTNPWDAGRSPGGSAGGSAAALAAGHTGFELGSDLAGSIRIPAANCGVVGLKPSHGIIPTRGHIPGPPGTLAAPALGTVGPLGRSADDLALGLDVLAGPDARSARAWHLQLPGPRHATLGGYRIAVVLDDPYCPVDASVLDVLGSLVTTLRSSGATLEDTPPAAPLSDTDLLFQQTLAGVTAAFQPPPTLEVYAGLVARADPDDTGPLIQWARWSLQTVRDWSFATERRAQLKARWAEFFTRYDALLCPVSNVPALPHDDSRDPALRTISVNGRPTPYLSQSIWSGLATVADLPAVAVPAGLTSTRLPVGVQVVAPYLEDRTAIDIARHIEQAIGRLPHTP